MNHAVPTIFSRSYSLLLASLIAMFVMLMGCAPAATPTPPPPTSTAVPAAERATITILTTSTVGRILTELQPIFDEQSPDYQLRVLTGEAISVGSSIEAVSEGTADSAGLSRPLNDEERALGLTDLAFGSTALAVIVHPDQEVTDLTKEQVADIFNGEITNWSEVGGDDLPIEVFIREEGNSLNDNFAQNFLGETPFSENVQVILDSSDMAQGVSQTPGAIGYINWAGTNLLGVELNPVSIDGVPPTDSDYPVLTNLVVAYREDNEATVQPLLDWLTSDDGRTALSDLNITLSE